MHWRLFVTSHKQSASQLGTTIALQSVHLSRQSPRAVATPHPLQTRVPKATFPTVPPTKSSALDESVGVPSAVALGVTCHRLQGDLRLRRASGYRSWLLCRRS